MVGGVNEASCAMTDPDGLTLLPAADEPATLGRHVPLPSNTSGAALLARRRFGGSPAHKGIVGLGLSIPPDFLTIAGSLGIGGTIGSIVVAWLNGRAGRKVRLKVGDTEVEARTVDEVKQLLEFAQKTAKKPTKKGG